MALTTNLTRFRSAELFVVSEGSSAGTLALPASGNDAFLVTDVPAMYQSGNYADLSEIGGELLTARRILNYVDYTDYDLNFYAKPSGSAGTAPAEDKLLEGFFGTGTNTGSTKETYTFSNNIRTFSVHSLMKGANVYDPRYLYSGTGSIPTTLSFALAKDGAVTYAMGMRAARVLYASTAEVLSKATSGNDHTITLAGPKLSASETVVAGDVMHAGMKIQVVDETAGTQRLGGIVSPSSISATGATFVATSSTDDVVANDLVQPDLGFAATPSAFDVLGQTSVQVFMSDQDADDDATNNTDLFHADNGINVTAFSLDMDRGISNPAVTEMDGSAFAPANYVMNQVSVSGSITMLCRPDDHAKLEGYRRSPVNALGLRIGDTAGKKIEVYMPAVHCEIPTMSEADGVAQLEIPFTLVRGSNSSDTNKFALRYL